jgi:amino acid adenylation domain-containing protein
MIQDVRRSLGQILSRGAILEAGEGQLRFQAAKGVLDGAARRELQERKAEILSLLGSTKVAVASFAQQRMWFLTELAPESPVYNAPLLLRLEGSCRLGPLFRACLTSWRRHESLRTRLEVWGDGPVQVVDPHATTPAIVDLSGLRSARRAVEEADRRIDLTARRSFDLATGPLARAVVFRLTDEDHRVLLSLHHSVADGWSANVLARELGHLYSAFAAGRPSPLPPLELQYAELALRERNQYERGELEESLRFWSRRLGALPPYVDLLADRPPPTTPSHRGWVVPVEVPRRLTDALRRLAHEEGASLFIVLLAAFQALLWRLSGQESFNVGTPIANRDRPGVEGVVGLFVNTLAVAADCSEEPSMREMVRRVRATVMAGMDHGEVPFDLVVERLGTERGSGRQPLFSVMFDLRPLAPVSEAWESLTAEISPLPTGTAKADLILAVQDRGDIVSGYWEASADLLDRTTVRRFGTALAALLGAGLDAPDRSLANVSLLDAPQSHQVLVEWSAATPSMPEPAGTVVDHVLARAAERPDAVAVVSDVGTLSFGGLVRAAGSWARRLRGRGVGPGSVVGVLCPRSPELVVAGLAAFRAGAAYLPFDPAVPEKRLDLMLTDSGAETLLTLRALADRVPPAWHDRTLFLDRPESALGPAACNPGSEDLAYVIYTSGSTGRPKAVAVPHAGLAALSRWMGHRYGHGPDDRATVLANPAFDASVWEIWPSLAFGTAIEVVEDEILASPPRLAHWLAERRISVSFVPTPLLELLLDELVPGAPRPRLLFAGGDRLRRRPDRSLAGALHNHYGPTEVSVVATGGRVEPEGDRLPDIGRPIAGGRAFVVDRRLRPVIAGVAGELCLGGVGVARGYLRRPALTAERFVPDPWSGDPGGRVYRSGDRVRWAADGRLEFLGRLDRQVQIRGYRVEPGEVEAVLQSHPAVRQAAVTVAESAGERRLVAYVAAGGKDAPSEEDLGAFLAQRLPTSMLPGRIVLLEAIPLTTRGKVDRERLPAPCPEGETASRVPPRTPKERVLAIIWSRVLGTDEIGAFDDFFALGGTSLQMMQVISRVREAFDVDLPPSLFYRTPTLAAIAEFIRRSQKAPLLDAGISISSGDAPAAQVVLLREGRDHPPLVCVHSAGGHLVEYLELATELASLGHPIYGVQARGLGTGQEPPPSRIEEMARGYVEALRALRWEGPYRFLGYCAGGLVALEMAQQLRVEGAKVDLLGMVEPPQAPLAPASSSQLEALPLRVAVYFAAELKVQTSAEELTAASGGPEGYPDTLWTVFERQAPEQAERLGRQTFDRLLAVYSAMAWAERRYVAARYPGRITLFEVSLHRTTPTALPSWSRVSAMPVDHHRIAGNHLTCMRRPYARSFADLLHQRLTVTDRDAACGARPHE